MGMWVGDKVYLSGKMASPITPADAVKEKPAVYDDTEAQTRNPLTKIQRLSGSMADDPAKGGKLIFAGIMALYTKLQDYRSAQRACALCDAGSCVGSFLGIVRD